MLFYGITLFFNLSVRADGVVVDKVYHPYVIANEREFEWRFIHSQTDEDDRLAHLLGYGFSVLPNIAFEVYLIGERDDNQDFDLQAYEFEARWMVTEQGEYWADWGLLFEFEKEKSENNYETTLGVLFEKELGKTSLTLNALVIYEWGQSIEREWETEFRAQYRYRYRPQFQPAIELYTGEDFVGVGPAFMGIQRFEGQKQLKWEAGFITEIAHSGKDHTLRLALEYEF